MALEAGLHEPVAGDAIGSGVVAIGDFNGDGSPDVAMATGMGSVAVFLGTRKGLFQPAINFPVEIGSSPPGGIKTADVNGDGKQDLVVALQDAIAILLGNGDGTVSAGYLHCLREHRAHGFSHRGF